jgi:hypothetical protein
MKVDGGAQAERSGMDVPGCRGELRPRGCH